MAVYSYSSYGYQIVRSRTGEWRARARDGATQMVTNRKVICLHGKGHGSHPGLVGLRRCVCVCLSHTWQHFVLGVA